MSEQVLDELNKNSRDPSQMKYGTWVGIYDEKRKFYSVPQSPARNVVQRKLVYDPISITDKVVHLDRFGEMQIGCELQLVDEVSDTSMNIRVTSILRVSSKSIVVEYERISGEVGRYVKAETTSE